MNLVSTVLVAVAVFASTNIDDLFLLATYFAAPEFRRASIVAGQFLGIAALTLASALAALAALALPVGWVALLGIVPLGLGMHRLTQLKQGLRPEDVEPLESDPRVAPRALSAHQSLAVAGVTIANGGDNLGVYIPLFAREAGALLVYAVVFALMTALWCVVADRLVGQRWLGRPLRKYGHLALPFVLIGLGVFILAGARVLLQ